MEKAILWKREISLTPLALSASGEARNFGRRCDRISEHAINNEPIEFRIIRSTEMKKIIERKQELSLSQWIGNGNWWRWRDE